MKFPWSNTTGLAAQMAQMNAANPFQTASSMQGLQQQLGGQIGQMAYMPASASLNITPFQAQVQRIDLPEENIVAAIIGWRAWVVGSIWSPEMRSYNGTKWEPYKKLEANHPRGGTVADPAGVRETACNGVYCTCGIYAWRSRDKLKELSGNIISGEVNLWGIVIEHRYGFRAQFAYPRSFIDSGFMARRMATLFGVKLIPKEEVNEIPTNLPHAHQP